MRLYNDLNKINEKVTKKEKKESLKNKNIYIGCEFEFKLKQPLLDSIDDLHKMALSDYNRYNDDVDYYNDELEKNQNSIQSIKDEMDDIETDISSLNAEILYNDDLSDSDVDDIEAQISDLEDKKESLQNELYILEDEHPEPPEFSCHDYESYCRYMIDYLGYTEYDLKPDYGEELELYPSKIENIRLDGDKIRDAIYNSDILNNIPFDDYEIGDYGEVEQDTGSGTWAIEIDNTISGDNMAGLEVKSPPMDISDFVDDVLGPMLSWIKKIGYTDSDCGLHIHMSLKKSNGIDPVKLLLFTEEQYIFNIFKERVSNKYTKSIKNKIEKTGYINVNNFSDILNIPKLKITTAANSYDGVRIVDMKNGHVEYRYMGGNYISKEKDIVDVIASYAYWLSLAADPDFKKKEYIHKITRVLNKMEMFNMLYYMAYIKISLEFEKKKEYINKLETLYNHYKEKYDILEKSYKLDNDTKKSLLSNKEYTDALITEITKTIKNVLKINISGNAKVEFSDLKR